MLTLDTVQNMFVQQLPTLQKMAKIQFRTLRPEAKQESISNALGLCWKFFHRLAALGRAEEHGILASCMRFAIRQTREGRTPQGCPRKQDTLSRRWVGPTRLDDFDLEQFVSKTTPIPVQVSFRVDVPAFMATLSSHQRKIAVDLANGMSTTEAAEKHDLSMGRISQHRRLLKDLFDVFFAD